MIPRRRPRALALGSLPLLAAAILLGGCARADKSQPSASSGSGYGGAGGSSKSMSVMGMEGSKDGEGKMSVGGIKPVPTQTLGSITWQGMKITARAMTAVPFVVYNGRHERLIKPGKASFHLMVFLDDAHTGVVIPYASVWATIRKGSHVVFDERQWPMLSRYMGPHYGNDVTVPGPGTYKLTLLISPPVSARHMEYAHVWTKPYRTSFTFHWKGT